MGSFFGKFESTKQEWKTPDNVFDPLDEEFHFDIDLAADKTNHKCKRYFSEKNNALIKDWRGTCWLNPPFGNKYGTIKDWVRKSYEESMKNNIIVMLIPTRTNTNWWSEYVMKSKEIRFIRGRPKFGDSKHGLPQPLAIIVFKRHTGETQYSSFALK